MDGAGGQHAGRGAKTVQRAAPCARQHFTTDADLDAQMSGARRAGDAHGLPDHSATRRLRADEARTFPARTREQSRFVGAAKSLGDPRRTAAIRCRAEPPRRVTSRQRLRYAVLTRLLAQHLSAQVQRLAAMLAREGLRQIGIAFLD